MANQVCEVLVTEAQLNATDNPMDPAAGAIVDFQGIVRGSENGSEIKGIQYEANREMAEHQLKQIAEKASVRFELRFVSIQHRIGFVAVGQASLLMRVCSEHREAAFLASQWIVDELKKKVPIWKRPEFKSQQLPGSSRGEATVAI
jgi:molybdopterin synthase catalytic subunit